MKKNSTIGIDIAKNIMHLIHLQDGELLKKQKLRRDEFLSYFTMQSTDCLVAMEACGGSNYWAQELKALGFKVKLLKTKDVKAFAKARQKNDFNDALAIARAANDPTLQEVRPKSKAQQDISLLHKTRANSIRDRVQKTNSLMSMLSEYGYVTKLSKSAFCKSCENEVSKAHEAGFITLKAFEILRKECIEINLLLEKEKILDKMIALINKTCKKAQKLETIIGIGPINASNLSIAPMEMYKSPRDFAASLGLVPTQKTSGDNVHLGGITKQGDRYTRTMLIQGGRSIAMRAKMIKNPEDKLLQWAQKKFSENKAFNLVCVGLANKLARIAYSVIQNDAEYVM